MSKGEYILEQFINHVPTKVPKYIINHRPDWLKGLELDFYFPELKSALEFQGEHHYKETEYSPNFESVRRRDKEKRWLCKQNGVRLITIDVIDLYYRRIVHRFKRAGIRVPKKMNKAKLWGRLGWLNVMARDYRNVAQKHKSLTSMRRHRRRKVIQDSCKATDLNRVGMIFNQ